MKRILVFLSLIFLPNISVALVGSIDHREYVDWSSPEYNKIVHFNTGRGTCTAEYIYPDIILTARHCITKVDKYDNEEQLNKQYTITLHDGRKTQVTLEKYGYDYYTDDWALLRVKDPSFYREDYYDVPDKTVLTTVQNAGFGFMRILTDEQIKQAKKIWEEVSAQNPSADFDRKYDIVEARLRKMGIELDDDPDPKTGVKYRFKADRSCELERFYAYTLFKSTCDSTQGNSGGPYFAQNNLYGIVHSGVGRFDDEKYSDYGVINETFVDAYKEMRTKSGGVNPTKKPEASETGQKNCIVSDGVLIDGNVYQKLGYLCEKYDTEHDFSNVTACECTCNKGKVSCKTRRCKTGYKLENDKCIKEGKAPQENKSPQETTSANMCVLDGHKYADDGETFWALKRTCERFDSVLDLTNVTSCECKCNKGKASCKVDLCDKGYSKENGKCKADEKPSDNKPIVNTPTTPAQPKCIVDGIEYADGKSESYPVDKCANFNSILNLTGVQTCACACNNNKMKCEIESCKDGYNHKDGKCVADESAVAQPVTKGNKCLSRGKVYNHGESQSVGPDLCVKIDGAMSASYTNALRSCKCTCDDGKMKCEIESCKKGYKPEGGMCVADGGQSGAPVADETKKPLFEKPTMLLSVNEKTAEEEKIAIETEKLNNESQRVGEMTDKEFFGFLKRTVDLNELRKNYEEALARETSLPNRILDAAAIGATGIGGMMLASAVSEQRVDTLTEQEMQAYLKTFTCEYGGNRVPGGETNVELAGGNDMISLYTEYATLANDLKVRKELLGLSPGIESEVVIDKAETGLYDDAGVGITSGVYASIARAIMNPDGEDAAKWNEQRAKTGQRVKTGAVVAGAGAIGGAVGNILINHTNKDKTTDEESETDKSDDDKNDAI